MLLLVAADPMEFAGLMKFCANVKGAELAVRWARAAELNGNRILMIANGAGAKQAANAVAAAGDVRAAVSTGFCGALDPLMEIGEIFVATSIQGGEAVRTPHSLRRFKTGAVASIDRVAQTAAEKRRLRATGATAVEMEAAGVAERARTLGIPFFCVRAVTDLAEESFANDFNAARRPDGHFDTMQILRSAIRRPATRLPELVRLRRRCAIAARTLGEFLADCRF
jgi:adenosylhomocysteine nucleosidase